MSCCNPKRNPLNGFSANTESGRLRKQMMKCVPIQAEKAIDSCCERKPIQEIKPLITPTESSYLASKMINCGTYVRSGAVPQSMAKELLKKLATQNYGTEGTRIGAVEQAVIECATDPFLPTARFSNYERIPEPTVCIPPPPPPAPPAKQCILSKNEKYYYIQS
jgi:hypothetical protein